MLSILLCAILTSVLPTASTDSLSISSDLHIKEALALVEKSAQEHIISNNCKDSLILVINSLPGETKGTDDKLQSLVAGLENKWDKAMKIIDNSAIATVERLRWLYNDMLPIPEDYLDPKELEKMNGERAMASLINALSSSFNYQKLWKWQIWLDRITNGGFCLFGNMDVYNGRKIPQMGGLYYISVPGGKPIDISLSRKTQNHHTAQTPDGPSCR